MADLQEGGNRLKVVVLDKVLLKTRHPVIRGVEIFNLNLIRELGQLGVSLWVPSHASWKPVLNPPAGSSHAPFRWIGCRLSAPWANGLLAALLLLRQRADVLLLANVANGLIPAVWLLHRLGIVRRCVLIAHREPGIRFLKAQARWPTTVLAVNRQIANDFTRWGFPSVHVHYGITHADTYHPPLTPRRGPTRFCVLGQLDNAWKGADTAMAAFKALPDKVRNRCELHLASFAHPPCAPGNRLHVYPWMAASEIPDFLRRMDVLVVPSRDEQVMRETFSQAMVQGMLTGLPVIASNLPVLAEKLDQGGGLVFEDVPGLTACMVRMATSPELRTRMGTAARQTARDRYVWRTETFAERFLSSAGD